jgi:D-threonine aldolase
MRTANGPPYLSDMNNGSPEWFIINAIDTLDSPALVIYEERVKHNIALAIDMIGDVTRLRPHVKTHKTTEVTMLMMHAGILKFKCATIAEAEMLALCGAPDILLAYQPVGPKLKRFVSLIDHFPAIRFSCLVDSHEAAELMSEEGLAGSRTIDAFLDLNVGMNRTGILPRDALNLYEGCKEMRGLRIRGVHAYDGHINDTDLDLRRQKADAVFDSAELVKNQLQAAGLQDPVVVIGGSPSFPIHAKRKDVECSPGTFVYWDKAYSDLFPDMEFLPAALVISRVVSIPDALSVCLDLGHKSVAAEKPLQERVYFLNEPEAQLITQSEEHLVVKLAADHSYKPGDVWYGIPGHVCPTCALYDSAVVIENKGVKEQWKMIARDRRINI